MWEHERLDNCVALLDWAISAPLRSPKRKLVLIVACSRASDPSAVADHTYADLRKEQMCRLTRLPWESVLTHLERLTCENCLQDRVRIEGHYSDDCDVVRFIVMKEPQT